MKSIFGRRLRTVSNSDKSAKAGVSGEANDAYDGEWHGSSATINSNISTTTQKESHPKTFHKCARIGDVEGIEYIIKHNRKSRKHLDRLDDDGVAPLHIAARFNHLDFVKVLVEKYNADVTIRDEHDECTALHYATKKKETGNNEAAVEIINYLALKMHEKGMDPNVGDKYNSTPLHFASMRGSMVITDALLKLKGIDINAKGHCNSTPVHDAVIYNNISIVRKLLEKGARVDDLDDEKTTSLHLASMEGNLEMIKLLNMYALKERRQAFIEAKDKVGNMPLHLAVENKNTSVVKYILNTNLSENIINSFCRPGTTKSSALHLAAIGGNAEIVTLLLEKGANVLLKDGDGMTPLHRSVEFEHLEVTKLLLDYEAPIEACDEDAFTPLLLACCGNNSAPCIKELLQRRADIHAVDNNENTAIRLCTKYNNVDGMKILLKYLKKTNDMKLINMPERMGNTPLHLACRLGRANITELLLDHDAEWHMKNEEEETGFHLASLGGYDRCCEILLDKTDNKVLNDEDEDSNTALHLASQGGHLEVVKLLTDAGADKEARNMSMWTPLDFAASEGHTEIVKFLLSEDVPVNPADKEGTTPLHLACKNGHLETVKLLLDSGARVGDKDVEGHNALDIAINNNNNEVAAAIIQSPHWMDALMSDSVSKKIRDTPMRKLVRKMPSVAKMAMDNCMALGPEGVSPEHDDAWILFNYEIVDDTFTVWDQDTGMENLAAQDEVYDSKGRLRHSGVQPYTTSTSNLKNNHLLMLMVKHSDNTGDLLFHPLMLSLIRHKWNMASIFYYIFLVFYIAFLSLFSAYTAVSTAPYLVTNTTECELTNYNYQGTFEKLATVILYVFCACGMALELFQIWAIRLKYLELNNLLDWFTYISTVFIILPFGPCGLRTDWQWQLAAFSVFIAWLDMLLFLRRLPRAGLYVVMIAEIFKTFMKFFIIFFLFIVAFAFSFNILLRNQDPFSTVFYSIIKMWVMMIGEFDFDTIFHPPDRLAPDALQYEYMTYTLFVAFLILMAIIVMNLLTGLAVDDVGALQANAMVKKVTMQIDLALDVEVALPYWIQRRVGFVHRRQKLHLNTEGNPVLKQIRRIVEGNFLSKESVCEKAVEVALQDDPEREKKEFEEKIMKKFRKQKEEIRTVKEQMNRMESMLEQLVQKKKEKRSSRRTSQLPENIPEELN